MLYFATSNKWKFNLARDYFDSFGILLKQAEIEIPEPRSEMGEEVTQEKADFAFEKIKKPLFVLDGSFHIKALNGFPNTYVKFAESYLGEAGILKLMVGENDRTCEFHNYLYYKDEKRSKCFVGVIKARVVVKERKKLRKRGKFDGIIIPRGYKKTLREMSDVELDDFDKKYWKPAVFDKFILWFKALN